MPAVPAAREAEAGELLELGGQMLQGAEITPLHSSLGTRVKLGEKSDTHLSGHGCLRGHEALTASFSPFLTATLRG